MKSKILLATTLLSTMAQSSSIAAKPEYVEKYEDFKNERRKWRESDRGQEVRFKNEIEKRRAKKKFAKKWKKK